MGRKGYEEEDDSLSNFMKILAVIFIILVGVAISVVLKLKIIK